MSGKSVTPQTGRAVASVNGTVVAEATSWQFVEGNVYFPPDSVKNEFMSGTKTSTYCPWKGDASYYAIDAGGDKLNDAAWYYATPLEKAVDIKDHVAFSKAKVDVKVE